MTLSVKKSLFIGFFIGTSLLSRAQDEYFGREMLYKLTSEDFWGRGYTKGGMQKAADFLSARFRQYGLKPFYRNGYFQKFQYAVNTFPGKMFLQIDRYRMEPGKDFIVSPDARGLRASGILEPIDSLTYGDRERTFIVQLQDKLTWSVAGHAEDPCKVLLLRSSLKSIPQSFHVDIENRFVPDFTAHNICGFVPGTAVPDSFMFITAHYDHLGGMGSAVYFPGANDNASGVSLLLNLARYYGEHPQRYSIGFILFAGEEIGLLGSAYFTEHAPLPLQKIRFLINTDLAGTGDEGITVVNATEFPEAFRLLTRLNDSAKWLPAINARGKAANSDHYYFSEKGVPAFFFYTLGGITAYHDIYDKPATLPLTKHEALFEMVTTLFYSLMNPSK